MRRHTIKRFFRYLESRKLKGIIPADKINEWTNFIKKLTEDNSPIENPMFEVYKKIATFFNVPKNADNLDLQLFKMLKDIITRLVLVQPKNRMKLEEAKSKLDELKTFTSEKAIQNFLLLDTFLQFHDDPTLTNIDETTQNSLRLMNEIRSTRLFTISTTGDDKKLTQRSTNLCVTFSAMRLLSYELVKFINDLYDNQKFNGDKKARDELVNKILKYPDNPETKVAQVAARERQWGYEKGFKDAKKEPFYIHKFLTICCGVISPRSLNGLNHCHLDDDFQIAAQEQNIRE